MWKNIFGLLILVVAAAQGAGATICVTIQAERAVDPGPAPYVGPEGAIEDEYLVGDWNGDGCDNLAVRRGNIILMDFNFDGTSDFTYQYGKGNNEDEYLVGDWDFDGTDEIAVRRGNDLWMDDDTDGFHDRIVKFGTGNNEDQYLVGDLNGDPMAIDDISVRRGNLFIRDLFPWDGAGDGETTYGNKHEDQYMLGHWDGVGTRQTYAVRRGNQIWMNYNFDGMHDFIQTYGGKNEDEYLVGDWDGDGLDEIAVRRGNMVLMNYDYDGFHDFIQQYGTGTN